MDSATKTKIIIFSTFGILILGFFVLLINSGSSSKQNDVPLRAIDTAEVSVQDIMAQRGDRHHYENETYNSLDRDHYSSEYNFQEPTQAEKEEEIALLQEQLRQNMAQQVYTNTYPPSNPQQPPLERPNNPEKELPHSPYTDDTLPSSTQPIETQELDAINSQETERKPQNRFYSGSRKVITSGINVAVLGEQEVQQGSSLKMALEQPLTLEGMTIPKGTAIYGIVRMTSNRLYVTIQSIRYRDRTIPYSAQVYDRDGLEGINIIESPSNDVSQQTGEAVVQEVANSTGILGGTIGRAVNTVSGIFRKRGGANISIVIKSNYQLSIR